MSKRIPLKGEPDFTAITDEKLVAYKSTVQEMIHSYFDEETSSVLKKVWKQLSDECADRQSRNIDNEFIAEKTEPLKTVKIKTVKLAKRIKR